MKVEGDLRLKSVMLYISLIKSGRNITFIKVSLIYLRRSTNGIKTAKPRILDLLVLYVWFSTQTKVKKKLNLLPYAFLMVFFF